MTPRFTWVTLLPMAWLAGCQCEHADVVDLASDGSASSLGESSTSADPSSDDSTGAPFDASRWIGRYHFENAFLPFGERGDSHGSNSLANFEILPDSRATMFYDNCSFEQGITTAYEWAPSEDGWLTLRPGAGDASLRIWADTDVETLRVQMIGPCRELRFEVDGWVNDWIRFYPGESCWVDRCTAPNVMQVDYCEGEEPPPCP